MCFGCVFRFYPLALNKLSSGFAPFVLSFLVTFSVNTIATSAAVFVSTPCLEKVCDRFNVSFCASRVANYTARYPHSTYLSTATNEADISIFKTMPVPTVDPINSAKIYGAETLILFSSLDS
jgi:hypothetical protein